MGFFTFVLFPQSRAFHQKAELSPDVSHCILSYHSHVANNPAIYANSYPCWHQRQLALPTTYKIKKRRKT